MTRAPHLWTTGLVAVAVALHLAITIPLAATLGLWIDEVYSLATTGGSLQQTLHAALYFELQPPLYFLMLSLWRGLFDGAFAARLFSILCSSLAIVAIAGAAKRYLGPSHSGWLAVVFAVNPVVLWTALEIRAYALVLLLAAALLLFLHRGFLDPRGTARDRALYSAIAVLAVYTQYYLALLLLANLAIVHLCVGAKPAGRCVAWTMLAGLTILPVLAVARTQLDQHSATATVYPVSQFATILVRRLENILFGWDTNPLPWTGRMVLRLSLYCLLLGAVWKAGRSAWRPRTASFSFAVACLFLFGSFLLLAQVVGGQNVAPRHTVLLVPPTVLLLGAVVGAAARPRLCAAIAALLVALSALAAYGSYRHLAKRGDCAHIAAFLHARAGAHEPIFVFPSEQAFTLAYHFHGSNPIIALPRPASLEAYNPSAFVIANEEEVASAIHSALSDGERAWLVASAITDVMGVDLHRQNLDAVVSRDFSIGERHTFFGGVQVLLLLRKPKTASGRSP